MDYIRLWGTGVSPGIASGEVELFEQVIFTARVDKISANESEGEWNRIQDALGQAKAQLTLIKNDIDKRLGGDFSIIFEAHLLILNDKSLLGGLKKSIFEDLVTAECALSREHEKYMVIFDAIADEYLRQRKADISDVLTKLYLNLKPTDGKKKNDGTKKILIAHDLLPSEAATRLSSGTVLAVAMDVGGTTSHTAILARSLNIPAVMGLSQITQKAKEGDIIIVDGTDGEIIINPPMVIQREFLGKKKKYDDYRRSLQKTAKLKAETLDKIQFSPLANIELPEEVEMAFSLGAEGIGLFRSEFIYFRKHDLPDEEDHFSVYSYLSEEAAPAPVYIRTIDVGGEKNLPQMKIEKESNPALGLRAIRFSLRERELFKIQLRAILRASVRKNVRVLIPMITELEEIAEVKILLEEVKADLRLKRVGFDENIPLGVMIEVPAAAAISDKIVKEVDYLSIGTNDLIQYYLAVDRSNELVSYLFKPLHPSVLRLLKFIIMSAYKEGKEVTVCGEMAADPLSALVLLGLGLKNFSMNPIFIPRIKRALRSVSHQNIKRIVQKAMTFKTAQEIEEFLLEKILFTHPTSLLMQETHNHNDLK